MMKSSSLKKPKAAIYVRVSTEEQVREGYSLNAQESALRDYLSMMGYDLYKIYRDEGKSAKDIHHRPALQQLLKDAEKRSFKAICVYKLDRFSRSLKDLILTIEMLKKLNIDFISMQDKIETASASGKLMFHIISSFAEFERDIISERTRFGMIEKAKEGGVVSRAAFGYVIRDGKLLVNNDKRNEVIDIFTTYVETNKSLNKIAREHKLTVRGLIKILSNRIYIGEVKFRDNYSVTTETILSKELFEKAQAKLHTNSHDRVYTKYTNFLLKLDPNIKIDYLNEFALALAKKLILCKKRVLDLGTFTEKDLVNMPEPFKLQKYVITQQLLEEGFNEEDIAYNRVFVNADKVDVYVNSDKKVYIDCTTANIDKIMDYVNNEVEYWLVLDNNGIVECYSFIKDYD
jgi:DNA invertase Pin-like site-specific DNA recombinase